MILLALACAPADTGEPAPPAAVCATDEPTGLEVGRPAQDVALTDCAGAPVSLHGLCGRAALVVSWYGWCPSCQDNAELAQSLAAEHPDLSVAVVLVQDPLSQPADADLCALYEDTYPSAAQTWTDPEGGLEVYGTTDLVVVLDAEGILRFVRQTAGEAAIVAAVEEALAG